MLILLSHGIKAYFCIQERENKITIHKILSLKIKNMIANNTFSFFFFYYLPKPD